MEATKRPDRKLQLIQKYLLSAFVPVVKVMEELYHSMSDPASLDITKVIGMLADSLSLTGTANVNLIKTRRELIKKDPPVSVQRLCSSEVVFSGSILFGENPTSSIKEVNCT